LVALDNLVGIVPQENTTFGSVVETYNALRKTGFVAGEVTRQIRHCLVAKEGMQLGDIRQVYSHEQVRVFSNDY
jgi:prephenate dehydratase